MTWEAIAASEERAGTIVELPYDHGDPAEPGKCFEIRLPGDCAAR